MSSDLNENVERIVSAMADAAGEAAAGNGRDAVIEMTMAATALAVRFAIAGGGGIGNGRKIIDTLVKDFFAQVESPKP